MERFADDDSASLTASRKRLGQSPPGEVNTPDFKSASTNARAAVTCCGVAFRKKILRSELVYSQRRAQ
jgi:hypothetical protein